MYLRILLPFLIAWGCFAQPYTGPDPLASLDSGGDGAVDFRYSVVQEKLRELPDVWLVGFSLEPLGESRLLRYSSNRVDFPTGTEVSLQTLVYTNIIERPGRPPLIGFDLFVLGYQAVLNSDWQYLLAGNQQFASLLEFHIGIRIANNDGIHLGWMKFSRGESDLRTPFQLVAYAAHPVPGEGILAGQLPPLPSVGARVSQGTLVLSWDARWGPLGLECSPSPAGEPWKALDGAFIGGTTLGVRDEKMFVRLRRP